MPAQLVFWPCSQSCSHEEKCMALHMPWLNRSTRHLCFARKRSRVPRSKGVGSGDAVAGTQ